MILSSGFFLNSGFWKFGRGISIAWCKNGGRSKLDKLGHHQSAKLTTPPSCDARMLLFIAEIVQLCLQHDFVTHGSISGSWYLFSVLTGCTCCVLVSEWWLLSAVQWLQSGWWQWWCLQLPISWDNHLILWLLYYGVMCNWSNFLVIVFFTSSTGLEVAVIQYLPLAFIFVELRAFVHVKTRSHHTNWTKLVDPFTPQALK